MDPPGKTPPRPGTLGRDPAPGRGPDGSLGRDFRIGAPQVSLPKGGGAIGGMGEKVTANPVTGSASLSIPLPLTPGRGGFTPSLSLSYDSGTGNGPFGLGWKLSLPSIRRKTDRGLPQYRDDIDVFVLSDAEDLVPISGAVRADGGFDVARYRPRVEGGFARIERWRQSDGRVHWRTISRDHIRRTYGLADEARVVDPDDPRRVFEWLLEEEADERGNLIRYTYAAEDSANVPAHPAEARRGTPGSGVAYRYPKRVSWGNTTDSGFRFHLVFDYGDHDALDPGLSPSTPWPTRADPFSSFRAGFDVRCYRLCRRVLLLHDFGSVRTAPFVVRSVALTYEQRPTVTTLAAAQTTGWRWTGAAYEQSTLPAVTFTYAQPTLDPAVRLVDGLRELPNGFDPRQWQFVDLDGEGLTGLLTQQGASWWYKRSEGDGTFALARQLQTRPNARLGDPGTRLVDVDGDGNLDLVVLKPGVAGYYARAENGWQDFRSFRRTPNVDPDDPAVRWIDLDGDGHADLMRTDDDRYTWWPSEGRDGFDAPRQVRMPHDADRGPRVSFDRDETVFVADMTGDGLPDLVQVRNGNVCYWPNRGHGRFGARVQMRGAPRFARDERFDPSRVRLADVDGSGPADLLYLGPQGVTIWFNESGNGLSGPTELRSMPSVARPNDVAVADLLGDGTACLVWSSPLLSESSRPLRYVRLMAEGKPWLLKAVNNGLGRETRLTYTPSTAFYLADRRAGTPWATRLPFPVHCLSKLEQVDAVTGWRFVNTYAYHHGYFDGEEREFRGFGLVEQWDTESVSDYEDPGQADPALVVALPPVRTRTWFHTGAWTAQTKITSAYAAEYSAADPAAGHLPDPSTPAGLTPRERRDAHRALKGKVLRQEVYAEDGAGHLTTLYAVTEATYAVVRLQAADGAHPASFRVDATESRTSSYDLDPAGGAPDPRVSHALAWGFDAYGIPTHRASVAYPRRGTGQHPEPSTLAVLVTETEVVHQDRPDAYHVGVPVRTRSWALTAPPGWTDVAPATVAGMASSFDGGPKRLLGHQLTRYWDDGLTGPLPVGILGVRALVHQRYALALTPSVLDEVYGARVDATDLALAGYVADPEGTGASDGWWIPSGRTVSDPTRFYQPVAHVDPFGNPTQLTWDADALSLNEVEDAVGMRVTAELDHQVMQPWRITDPNGTSTEATFDPLGRVLTTATRNGLDGDGPGEVGATFTYDTAHTPASVHAAVRERYHEDVWQSSWSYSDGGGAVVQTQVQAAPDVTGAPRFVGTGRTVLNNKGLPVKQYEPFFSPTSAYEDEDAVVAAGVTPILAYDPAGRNTEVTLPDGHVQRWTYTPWQVSAYDEHDTDPTSPFHDTPTTTQLDAQGRVYRSTETPDGVTGHVTHLTLDVQGDVLQVTDARGNPTQVQTFDLIGRPVFTGAADEGYDGGSGRGETRVLYDVAGQPLQTWRSGNLSLRTAYDPLRRPVGTYADDGAGERRLTRTVYGDAPPEPPPFARGRPVQVDDPAGRVTLGYDFRGRTVAQTRQVLADITVDADWDADPALDPERFTVATSYDALDRVTSEVAPDGSITTRAYDEGGRLVTVAVALRGTAPATSFVDHIAYDARGQRLSIAYGNGTSTTYAYDPHRFWLTRLHTVRGATALQDLRYTLDAAGNLVEIRDDAQQTEFFANAQVTPTRTFAYDARYRLVQATGREKVDQRQTTAFYADYAGAVGTIPDPSDPALRQYTQSYRYDAVGNLLEMKHQQGLGGSVVWRRGYAYEPGNNQLVSTSAPGDDPDDPATHTDRYPYNERGAMTAMPHLPALVRDPQDQIRRADLDLGGSVAWYAYDAAGQRVRKRVDKGGVQEERIYVGGYEVWRKRTGSGLQEERQTLHVMDDQRRIALVETLTVTGGAAMGSPTPRQRFQLGDHLGTATLEVDEVGAVISYEEYHPFGTTAWYAETAGIQVSAKRYRYTGMEKDEETGLHYHDARFYMPWLGRWEQPDPIGLKGGINRFAYCRGNPVGRSDSTGTNDTELYNLYRGSDADEIGQIARDAGSSDVGELYDELNATAVDGVGRVQIGDRNIEIGLQEPRQGSSYSSFTAALGIDYAIGAAVQYSFEHNPALQFGAAVAGAQFRFYSNNIPGFTIGAEAVVGGLQSEPVQQTLGTLGDAAMLSMFTGMIRYGTSKPAGLLTDSRAGQKLLTDSRAGRLSLAAEGGEVAVVEEAGALSESRAVNPYSVNRTHSIGGNTSSKQVSQMAEAMRTGGWQGPPIDVAVHDGQMYVLDGHHRLAASKMAELKQVPVRTINDIAAHPSGWSSIDDVLRDAARIEPNNLRVKGKRLPY
ncbi:MAG: SpvB/TcaC N-terminal domain-containing protein [Myxococcota bacterium]